MSVVKSVLLLLLFVVINADNDYESSVRCDMYHFSHGRVRLRRMYKLARFLCYPRFTLVGNRYVNCVNGEWDAPWPVCVRPGCAVPKISNAIQIMRHSDAWMTIYCLPGFEAQGGSTVYCDGHNWNSTLPSCVETTAPSKLSCNFEDADLCGWKQDELHDFDWRRLNRKTPSSFLFTGPSYDHTYGSGGSGYYMYIESTGRLENDTARLLSPVYKQSLIENRCFSFFYHMFGKYIGGLRVYQKPDSLPLDVMLKLSDSMKQSYLLFEQWGSQGNVWYGSVTPLKNQTEDFQIVIEGIRGRSYTSDIAIDDVAILEGDNCTIAKSQASTPTSFLSETCNGRCDVFGTTDADRGCGCTAACVTTNSCCADFFEMCVFDSDTPTTEDDKSSSAELPQTQKLVASNTTTEEIPTDTTKLTKPTPKETTTIKTTVTTKKLTTIVKPTTITIPTTSTTRTKATKTTIFIPTTKLKPTTKSTIKPTTSVVTTKPTTRLTTKKYAATTVKATTKDVPSILSKNEARKGHSSGTVAGLVIMGLLICCMAGVWMVYASRGSRGRILWDRIRGRAQQDPEVRYLHADTDDE